jgi:hypothetical protein
VIGVISKDAEVFAVCEVFQLFKTPWENYVTGHAYDLVITTTDEIPFDLESCPIVVYSSRSSRVDNQVEALAARTERGVWLQFQGAEFPLYGDALLFHDAERPFLRSRGEGEIVGFETTDVSAPIVRVGYDLFQEVKFLLSTGQPSGNAHIPTLEFHISLLRNIMFKADISFVEMLPAPSGYEFIACLTHDVDFTGIREHKFDSTMWGFLYRALVGSVVNAAKGRETWSKCRQNWQSALSLPLVHLGLKDDFWLEFDRFMEIEKDLGSTFFFIPFKNRPGTRGSDAAPRRRAAKYDLLKIKDKILDLVNNGCEVGLHGIDAWQDPGMGRTEQSRIREITQQPEIGVRMHWLYFDENSPGVLEDAGFSYDSTFGYNDAIGFRGGTAQVHGMASANSLLELPLSLQDTALFYPDRMNLSEAKAMDACRHLIRQTVRFGGVLTINWHTRSLSPERLWGGFYGKLLEEIQKYHVWFTTAQDAANWFRTRRALRFEQVKFMSDGLQLRIAGAVPNGQPSFVMRVHHSKSASGSAHSSPAYTDIPWKGETELTVALQELSRN